MLKKYFFKCEAKKETEFPLGNSVSRYGIAFVILFLLFAPAFFAFAADPLVPCTNTLVSDGKGGFKVENQCSACEIFTLSQNVLNFFYAYITIPIATVMFLWAGFLMLYGGMTGAAGNFQKGGRIMKNTLIGIVIIFCSWLVIDTIIKAVANQLASGEPAQLPRSTETVNPLPEFENPTVEARFGPWNRIECVAPQAPEFTPAPRPAPTPAPAPTPSPAPGPAPTPTGDDFTRNRSNAAALAARGIVFSAAGDCGGASAHTNFEELRNSRPITICSSGCTAQTACRPDGRTADPRMLGDLTVLAYGDGVRAGFNFQVTSIATGSHASLSAHYAGKAVDLAPVVRTSANFLALRDRMRELNPSSPRVQCEDNGGTITGCGSGTTHVHVSYP